MLTIDITGHDAAGVRRRIPAGAVVEILARSGDLYTVRYEGITGVARFYDLLPF
jgi:hypothetical protein